MKTLIEFLLAEAKSGEENTEVASINQEDWNRLSSISPGPISKEVRELLNIKSAKDAKIVASNQTAKAIKDPGNFRKGIEIRQTEDFAKLMNSILTSAKDFKIFFSSVKVLKHYKFGKVAKIALSSHGTKIISADTQLIRFYKFWFDSIIYACLVDGQRANKRDKFLRYKRDSTHVYVWYGKA